MTANYKVWREGYRATVSLNDGNTGYTDLYPRCDYGLLNRGLSEMVDTGKIKSYQIEWVKVEVNAG